MKKYLRGCDEKNNPNELENRPSLCLLKDKPDLVGVEVGVRWGCNALRMLLHLNIKCLYLVDPYKPFPVPKGGLWMNGRQDICDQYFDIAKYNLEGFNNIVWMLDFSYNIIDLIPDDIDFVYIDGDHRYEAVIKDINLFYPKLKKGGLLAGHDYTSTPSVTNAVNDIFEGFVESAGDDWWIWKKD